MDQGQTDGCSHLCLSFLLCLLLGQKLLQRQRLNLNNSTCQTPKIITEVAVQIYTNTKPDFYLFLLLFFILLIFSFYILLFLYFGIL